MTSQLASHPSAPTADVDVATGTASNVVLESEGSVEVSAGELVDCSPAFFRAMGARLANETRRAGWLAPAFASPPSNPDVSRSLVRHPDGSATVAVRLDRPAGVVAEDMIAGVKALNSSVEPSRQMSVDELECELWVAALGLG